MAGDAILDFQIVKFHWQTVSGRPRLIIVLNVVKIGRLLWRHCNFSNFQNGRLLRIFAVFQDGDRRHLRLSNPQNFIG